MSGPATLHVATPVHGRLLVERPPAEGDGKGPFPLLVGFHGYGEIAELELARQARVPGSECWVRASVQALHPFYNARSGEIGASWMTRLDRELAIDDNLEWVRRAVGAARGAAPCDATLVFGGFSQGVATAWRAGVLAGLPCAGIVAIGGDVPPEILARVAGGERLPPVFIGRGENDEWYTAEKVTRDLDALRAAGVDVTYAAAPGGHLLPDAVAVALGGWLRRFAG